MKVLLLFEVCEELVQGGDRGCVRLEDHEGSG